MKSFNFKSEYEELMQYLETLDSYESLKFKFIGDKILIFSKANTYQVMSFVSVDLDFDAEIVSISKYAEDHIKSWSKESNVIISVTTYSKSIRLREFDATDQTNVIAKLSFFGKDMLLTLFPFSAMYEIVIDDEEIAGDSEQILKVLSELERKYADD